MYEKRTAKLERLVRPVLGILPGFLMWPLALLIACIMRYRWKLLQSESEILESFKQKIRDLPKPAMNARLTNQIVALVGLVGEGKSTVAQILYRDLGGCVISGDDIRVALGARGLPYDRAFMIAEDLALFAFSEGHNVILDSNYRDDIKRASLWWCVDEGRLHFIRVHCHPHIVLGRILSDTETHPFFVNATCRWEGEDLPRGQVMKITERERQQPQHYKWRNVTGGRWELRTLPIKFLKTIDTSDSLWIRQMPELAARIKMSNKPSI